MLAYVSLKIYVFYVQYGVSSNYVLVKKEEIKKRKQNEKNTCRSVFDQISRLVFTLFLKTTKLLLLV